MSKQLKQVKENNTNDQTLSSLEVAEMVEKPHYDLIKNIRRYDSHFNDGNISSVDFWTETTYTDSKGEKRPCYLVTKKGCEFIAHKMTGAKGTIFTARYINRFHEMEKQLSSPTLQDTRLEIARLILKATKYTLPSIKELYPEYFTDSPEIGSLEYASDINTAYMKWKEDYDISIDWISSFPTIDIYNHYVRFCIENKSPSMGKQTFYNYLEFDFNLTRKQKGDGRRYFLTL